MLKFHRHTEMAALTSDGKRAVDDVIINHSTTDVINQDMPHHPEMISSELNLELIQSFPD